MFLLAVIPMVEENGCELSDTLVLAHNYTLDMSPTKVSGTTWYLWYHQLCQELGWTLMVVEDKDFLSIHPDALQLRRPASPIVTDYPI